MINREQALRFMKQVATFGSIGYLPASGTMATLATWPVIMIIKSVIISLQCVHAKGLELLIIAVATLLAWIVIRGALQLLPIHTDPPQIVLDESVGLCWALFGIGSIGWGMSFVGVIMFRFFDIVKPLGIGHSERLHGATGILIDDIMAGIYTWLVLKLLIAASS